jgi:hypothetical protein
MPEPTNPYAAPRAAAAPARPTGDVRGLYAFDTARKQPPVCLKCAAEGDVVRRDERMGIARAAARGVGLFGGATGAVIANLARSEPELLLPALGGALGVTGLIAWVVHVRTPRVDLNLPLCPACNDRWDSGVRARTIVLALLAVCGLGAAVAYSVHELAGALVALAGFVAVLFVAASLKLPSRFITARAQHGSVVYLAAVSPRLESVLEQRQAARKARKAARAAAAAESDAIGRSEASSGMLHGDASAESE